MSFLLFPVFSFAQSSEDWDQIRTVVEAFSAAGDQQDAAALESLLHPGFRSVVHRAFGSEETSLMTRDVYLQLIREKKIGGDKRNVYLLQMDQLQNLAQVKVIMAGEKLHFTSYLSLVKLPDGRWQIVGDLPVIQ